MNKLSILHIFLVCLLFLSNPLSGQNTVYLLDEKTEKGVENASIVDPLNDLIYTTDKNGSFLINDKTKTLNISHISYESRVVQLDTFFPQFIKLNVTDNSLDEIIIRTGELKKPPKVYPFNLSLIKQDEIYLGAGSLSPIISSKSGVLLEERANGSYRVSIRGSSLRSPYGVRNIKTYYYGIPFSSAFGLSDLNSLDVSHIRHIEILKGPSGSIYGAGNGGVLLLNNSMESSDNTFTLYNGIGSFGQAKLYANANIKLSKGFVQFAYSNNSNQAYRNQNELKRQNFEFIQSYKVKQNQFNFLLWGSKLYYQIPGGLTENEFAANPAEARPRSEDQHSSLAQNKFIGGMLHSVKLKNYGQLKTQFSLQFKSTTNPFILDYKKEKELGFTLRSVYSKKWFENTRPLATSIGFEFITNKSDAKNYQNNKGLVGQLRFHDRLSANNLILFQQVSFDVTKKLNIIAALSENLTYYNIDRLQDLQNYQTGTTNYRQDIQLIPRFSINYAFSDSWFIFQSISKGFSTPAINEIRTNDGGINVDLKAETLWSYEIGGRYTSPKSLYRIDASFFVAKLTNSITNYTNFAGVSLFQNSGNVNQKGVEIDFSFRPISNSSKLIKDLEISSSYTGHFFRFKNFKDLNSSLNGNKYTGVAPHILNNQLNISLRKGVYFRFSQRYNSSLPLNNENSVYQKEFNILRLGFGWKAQLGEKISVDLYCILDNLTNERYSLGNDLNAFANRFYQPAPTRNWMSGITFKTNL